MQAAAIPSRLLALRCDKCCTINWLTHQHVTNSFAQVAAVRSELQRQLAEAQALADGRAASMKEMQDKIQHLSARVRLIHSYRVERWGY